MIQIIVMVVIAALIALTFTKRLVFSKDEQGWYFTFRPTNHTTLMWMRFKR